MKKFNITITETLTQKYDGFVGLKISTHFSSALSLSFLRHNELYSLMAYSFKMLYTLHKIYVRKNKNA